MPVDTFDLNGKKIVIRHPKISDTRKVWKFYNQAIRESLAGGGFISRITPVSLKEEKKWVEGVIKKVRNKKCIQLLVECDNKIIGSLSVEKGDQAENHVGNFGIVLLEEFTGKGIGTRFMSKIIQLSKSGLDIEIVKLSVFGNNKRAQKLYKKLGFKEVGRIKNGIKVRGKYQDCITMVKYLK